MPIDYKPDTTWPPADCREAEPLYDEWATWYGGRPEELARFYGGNRPAPGEPTTRRRGGVRNWLQTMWWGRPVDSSEATVKLHIPAAADISMLSADGLFGEMPKFAFPPGAEKTGDRLDAIIEESGLQAALLEAAELDSSRGGIYLRVFADRALRDVPLVGHVLPENAAPEWRYDLLTAVTFWQVLKGNESDKSIWRHLERHEVIGAPGKTLCYVFHALYHGSAEQLGKRHNLRDRPETERFAEYAEFEGVAGSMFSGSTLLDCAYIPNVKPHRLIKGSPLGRSDYSGAEGAMDQLDEAWSSLMRDLDLGKGRLVLPREMLRSNGPGDGATFNSEQSIFTPLQMMVSDDGPSNIHNVQFNIRAEEHLLVASGLWRIIVRAAGLSAAAFGEEAGGGQQTATEAGQRAERKAGTRDRKIAYWRSELRRLVQVILEIDIHVFHTPGIEAQQPTIDFPDASAISPQVMAQTLQLLDAAKAISTREKVAMLHSDWTDKQIDAEAAAITGETAAPVDQFDMPPTGDPTGAPQPPAPPIGPGQQPPNAG